MSRFLLVLILLLSSCAEVNTARDAAAHIQSSLYFGFNREGGKPVGPVEWSGFLEGVVTPRFPDGFTVLDAHGQWRDMAVPGQPIVREESRVLIIIHPASEAASNALREIKAAYTSQFQQKSVLHTESPVRLVE